ncbi:hypothetical protein [Streptomyces sp. NPDC059256]|uniref:hypothetical protein n=1 Tax=Streptomyces sp. NPDC059256 TaxID=3346794 RepID=UPI00368BAC3C
MSRHPPVIVQPPSRSGGRRVTVNGRIVGFVYGRGELAELLRAELAPTAETIDLVGSDLIQWRGGGADDWSVPQDTSHGS